MVVWLFLAVPWVCLRFVIVVFPDHTHLIFIITTYCKHATVNEYKATGLYKRSNNRVIFIIKWFRALAAFINHRHLPIASVNDPLF